MALDKSEKINEKRQYLRLDTVFPIEFQLIDKDDRRPVSEFREGFTRNVGKGGMGIFSKTLKEKDKDFFNFVPGETKMKLIINIPLDDEPIESFATVEWVQRENGPIVDTYMFGISYDFINEIEYEKIMNYVKWIQLKPKLILLTVAVLAFALIFSVSFLFRSNVKRQENEKKLEASIAENRRAMAAKEMAEQKKINIEAELESLKKKQSAIQSAFMKLAEEKNTLENMSKLSEETKKDLETQLEDLTNERELLEEEIAVKTKENEEITEGEEAAGEEVSGENKVSDERLKSEEENYNKFRELILNEKLQSLSAYVSTHRSSIYHVAALFALAELRYKYGERALAEVNYNQIIEFYPKSKYAQYASHRMDQLRKNYNYDSYSLQDYFNEYNLPELSDYRNIEPYVR